MPLPGTSARFLFVHAKKKRFVWLEAAGATLLRAEGVVGQESSAVPKEQVLATPAAAVRQRDLATAKLLGEGYALSDFGASADPAPKKKSSKKTLASNPELEAMVRERDDEESWQVFEDWLLDAEDPRAEIIRCEKSGDRGGAAEARGRLGALLFGAKTAASGVRAQTWRAGFARDPVVTLARSADGAAIGKTLVAAPAMALARELSVEIDAADSERDLFEAMKGSPAASSIRRVVLQYLQAFATTFDTALVAPFTRLEGLRVIGGGIGLKYAPNLASLRELDVHPLASDAAALFAPDHFAELRTLVLHAGHLELPYVELDALLDGRCAPKLVSLRVRGGQTPGLVDLVSRLSRSPLASRLESLAFDGRERPRDVLPSRGRSFGALKRLELPPAVVEGLEALAARG